MRGESLDQPGVASVDLVAGETAAWLARDRDEAEAAGSEHDRHLGVIDLRFSGVVGVSRLSEPRGRLCAALLRIGVARRHEAAAQLGDEVGQRVTRALLERRSLRLAVVGQHHDLVGPRRPPGHPLDARQLAVEVAQHAERLDALRARVVGDLVVAEHVDVDRRAPLAHVVHHALHGDVACDDRGERSQQRVHPATLDAWLDAPPALPGRRHTLAPDLDQRRDHRPRRLAGAHEVAEVPGAGAPFLATACATHRERRSLGVTREQVAVARTVVGEQAVAVGMGALDRRRTLGVVRDDHRPGALVDPPEGRHLGGRAVQDAALADAGL
jgi:hypothetical protein